MLKNPNHHNFISTDDQTKYLQKLALEAIGADFSTAKSEIFRKVVQEHMEGIQYLTPRICSLLNKIGVHYDKDPKVLLERLLIFIQEKKPNLSVLGISG